MPAPWLAAQNPLCQPKLELNPRDNIDPLDLITTPPPPTHLQKYGFISVSRRSAARTVSVALRLTAHSVAQSVKRHSACSMHTHGVSLSSNVHIDALPCRNSVPVLAGSTGNPAAQGMAGR
eukprot:5081979-Prymnesium_polylepis.1